VTQIIALHTLLPVVFVSMRESSSFSQDLNCLTSQHPVYHWVLSVSRRGGILCPDTASVTWTTVRSFLDVVSFLNVIRVTLSLLIWFALWALLLFRCLPRDGSYPWKSV